MIVGGEDVIAYKNTDRKTFVLYPRGKAFITRLSGQVTARRGSNLIRTSENLQSEIRRGDAICIDRHWFRVSSLVGNGNMREQTQRSTAPLSVTSDKEMSDKNVYYESYTAEVGFLSIAVSVSSHTEYLMTTCSRYRWMETMMARPQPQRGRNDMAAQMT
jgi:hypothetical protein